MARKADVSGRIIDAALALAAHQGWLGLSLAEIAGEAGLPLSTVHGAFSSKAAILRGFLARVDQAVLAGGETDAEETARDRLFDLLMRRFDALAPHKQAVAALLREGTRDPSAAVSVLPGFLASMALMLEAAGLSASGLRGVARVQGLAVIQGAALRTWLKDDSSDMAATMAALDKGLGRAEALIRGLRRVGGKRMPA